MKKTERKLSLSFRPYLTVGEKRYYFVEITLPQEWGDSVLEDIADAILDDQNVEELADQYPKYASSLREVAQILRDYEFRTDIRVERAAKTAESGEKLCCLSFAVREKE